MFLMFLQMKIVVAGEVIPGDYQGNKQNEDEM